MNAVKASSEQNNNESFSALGDSTVAGDIESFSTSLDIGDE